MRTAVRILDQDSRACSLFTSRCDSTFGNSRQFPHVEIGRSWALSVGDPACLRASFRSARESSAALRGDISRSARPRVVDLSPCPICAYGNLAQSGSGDRDTERIRTSLRCQENAADCMLPCEGCLRETRPAGIDPKRAFAFL